MSARILRTFGFLAMAGAALPALAAGGHHAVDDAALLEPGHCKVETWAARNGPRGVGLLHGATGCRLGPIEWAVGADRSRESDGQQRVAGVQIKWATALTPWLSAGASVAPAWMPTARPRERSLALTGLLTGTWGEDLRWHANLGRTQTEPGGEQTPRSGLSLDWAVRPGWQLMSEHFREGGSRYWRAGLRWQPAERWTVDASRAWPLRDEGAASTTLGLTFEFE